jgi:hypothetical protein
MQFENDLETYRSGHVATVSIPRGTHPDVAAHIPGVAVPSLREGGGA